MKCPRPASPPRSTRCAAAKSIPDEEEARRRLGRHRRHLLERADGDAQLPVEHPGGPGHNWANAISMATPIAHKGIQYGAKVVALTVIDLLTRPELVTQAWDYFNNVQTKNKKYVSLLGRRTSRRSG
jgi:hypothetical protein